MFESVNRIKFKNEVPEFWKQASKDCIPFNLSIPIERHWDSSKNRVLIIVEHVPSEDLSNRGLLSGNSLKILQNCFSHAERLARPYGYSGNSSTAFAAINFNYFKNYHLSSKLKEDSDQDAANRIRSFIRKYDPTHIISCGDIVTKATFPEIEDAIIKKGWIHNVKYEGKTRTIINTVDFGEAVISGKKGRSLEDDDDEVGDGEGGLKAIYVLGYFCRNIRNFLINKNPHDIGHLKVKAKLITSIKKFDKMMEELYAADKVAFDTEAKNLNKVTNKLLTLQFSTNDQYGYVVPYLHKDTPFSSKEILYIKKELRKFFMQKKKMSTEKYLIAFNAKFDITLIKHALGIPFIYWPVYDAQAGEHAHDETLRFMADQTQTPHGGMAQICANYGNTFYFDAAFSKKDRGNMEATDLYDKDFLKYCGADSQLLFALHKEQIKRAKYIVHKENGKAIRYKEDFLNVVIKQMSNNIHVFASMEQRGVHMDSKFVSYMKTRESPISQAIHKQIKQFNGLKAVKKVNKLILKENGEDTEGGLFDVTPWVFDIGKPDHKAKLFFDILRLKPLFYGKKKDKEGNKIGKIDKAFKKHYEDVPEVALLNTLEKLKKLKSSYVDAFARQLNEEDGLVDRHLRPMYGFFKVLTGRSNSEKPSLQQVPQHSENAKYIKRMFATEKGKLIIKFDMSAHEVRCWSIISRDKLLGELFAIGRRIRQAYRATGKRKYALELKLKGDVHRLNVQFFFGTPIDKVTKEERNAIKGVVFGAIYGKSYKTLAKELKKADAFTKDLYDRFFARFKKAAAWLEWAKDSARTNLWVKSAIGRRRHLFGHLVADKGIAGAMDRRAMNAPIQGMGADFGHTGARLSEMNLYEYLLKIGEIDDTSENMPVGVECMVHDSVFSSAPFRLVLAAAQIMQWCATIGTQEYYDKHFGVKFTVPLEIEMEFGASQDKMYKWDWAESGYDLEIHEWNENSVMNAGYTIKSFNKDTMEYVLKKDGKKYKGVGIKEGYYSLEEAIRLSLIDHAKIYPDINPEKEFKKMFKEWNDSKTKKYLDKHYPILGDYQYTENLKQAA